LVPMYIYKKLEKVLEEVKLAEKKDFIWKVCKYWSLKREERRGAALLKRLHLEVRLGAGYERRDIELTCVFSLGRLAVALSNKLI
jgi:hypothetical protein